MADTVRALFERALEEILGRVLAFERQESRRAIAVAYSGGLDSTVLLRLTHAYAAVRGNPLFAFHVHHGMSSNADRWLAHCAHECQRLDVPFQAQHVQVAAVGAGVEQAARTARYAALGRLCIQNGIGVLLTGHHLDDQAETVLLQLLRGAGVAGLAGMATENKASALLGQSETWIARPMLSLRRQQLEQWAHSEGLIGVEDETNVDQRYSRNRLRHALMPILDQHFPGYERAIARAAGHARAGQQLLDELADEDLQRYADKDGIDLEPLGTLSEARIDNLLRRWFALHGIRMPSAAWLAQLRTQVFAAGADAQVRVTHPDCEVWRYRGKLTLAPRIDEATMDARAIEFRWSREGFIAFPTFGGRLQFEEREHGLDPEWLRARVLTLRHRRGGETLKLAPNRPTRDLKHHFQAFGIPPWERRRLPLVEAGGDLLFAAGIGLNHGGTAPFSSPGVVLRWVPDHPRTCLSALQQVN